jgi:chromosome segregation protein
LITSITLQGFKSFAERTRLEFGPGVTAVIGPNGSGKSNVVEALRWVSHQARARELRAARATELIFHGSAGEVGSKLGGSGNRAGKAPLGLAEVQLELRTSAGERLHLSRRIYRDGAAEQDIMGRSARARDVQNALRGTGLGSGGLAVIGQGEVGSVVQAEGQILLAYVQEAAGLSRSVAARQACEQQLTASERQLAQVRLLEDELSLRTRRLLEAARAAERHRQLSLLALQLQDALARSRHLGAQADLLALQARAAALLQDTQALSALVQQAAADLDRAREGVAAARSEQQAQAQALELQRAAARAEQQAQSALSHLDRDLHTVQADLLALDTVPPEAPMPDLAAIQQALAHIGSELTQATRQGRALESALKQARDQAGLEAQHRAARSAQTSTLQAEAERLAEQVSSEQAMLAPVRAERGRLGAQRQMLEASHAEVQARYSALQQRGGDLRTTIQGMRLEAPPLEREKARLEASLNSYARYAEGPRTALQSDHPGIVGSVADLLSVPAEHETAVGAALGRRLEQVVVQSADDARDIIETLKRKGGRATFLPLDLLRPRPRRDAVLQREPGVIGNLSDLCPSDPPIVGQNLLSDTLLVSTLQAATALARKHASRPRLVTIDGELIEPGGALTGGRLRDSGAAVLTDQRRSAELQDQLDVIQNRLASLERELAPLDGDLEDLSTSESVARAARDQLRARERDADLQLAALEARCTSLVGQHSALLARLKAADGASVHQQKVSDPRSPEELESALDALRQRAEQAAQQERALNADLAAARVLVAAWTSHRQAVSRREELLSRQQAAQQRREDLLPQLSQLQAEAARHGGAVDAAGAARLVDAETQRDVCSSAYSALIARQNKVASQLEEAKLTLARREGSLGSVPDGTSPTGTPQEWQAAFGRAQRELDGLGAVNPVAEQEFRAEQDRLDALQRERADVEAASAELRGHLSEMDKVEQRETAGALERVGRAFAEYSGELLGGLGELELEHDEQRRLTGLRLAVQPKGKRTRSLNLLSAGERTMAGLAFLFALSHAVPGAEAAGLPLAVLDEVDAPLDEANIRRFTRFLTLFAGRGSQFLLVTHQKATMEVATALWGVTTDASGSSRVLSIRQTDDERPVLA